MLEVRGNDSDISRAPARALLERESLDGEEVALILRSGTPFGAATA